MGQVVAGQVVAGQVVAGQVVAGEVAIVPKINKKTNFLKQIINI
jgi:hypothetical protein